MIILVMLWVILSFVMASGAKKRNRSYIGYLVLSICFSPVISGLILLILGEN